MAPLLALWELLPVPKTRLRSEDVPGLKLAVLRGVAEAYFESRDASTAGVMWVEDGPAACP